MTGLDRRAARRATLVAVGVVAVLAVALAAVSQAGVAVLPGADDAGADDALPTSPTAPGWDDAANRTVELNEQRMARPFGGGTVDSLNVRAVANDSHVAFRLTWSDPTNDTSIGSADGYSDAAAIMFGSGEQPPIMMGANGTPVNIWYWRASWQYPGGGRTSGDMYAYPHPDEETKPGLAAGNPLSKAVFDRHAQNYYAKGYGSLSHADAQNVDATGRRTEEGWSVVFVRERSTDGVYDATFEDSTPTYLAFAVWNGSADEVNGQKSITLTFTEYDLASGTLSAPDDGGGDGDGGGAPSGRGGGGAPAGGGGGGGSGADGTGSGSTDSKLVSTPALVALALLAIAVTTWVGFYARERGGS